VTDVFASSPLRWGIISTAAIAADVIPGLQRSERNELLAVASRSLESARKFADLNDISRAYASYDALLDDPDIDCVYVPLPNHLHAEWTRKAILAGKHVLCEKPFVMTADEATRLFTLADTRGVHLAEAFMYRHHPKTHALKTIVSSGRLGDVHTIRSWFTYPAENAASDVRFQPGMDGGALRDVGSYPVSMCNYLLDAEPVSVSATQTLDVNGIDERFYGTMRYSDGTVATVDCSMRSATGQGVVVVGSLGTATAGSPWYSHLAPHGVEIVTASGTEIVSTTGAENAYFLETEHFADVVLNGADAVVPADETVRTARTLNRLRDAAV
jgi:D-xylose 1-dehydrogenase (NADP+, D-xylono-1,5-lactone-forming)